MEISILSFLHLKIEAFLIIAYFNPNMLSDQSFLKNSNNMWKKEIRNKTSLNEIDKKF